MVQGWRLAAVLGAALGLGCDGDKDDTSGDMRQGEVEIISPPAGAWLTVGEEVTLEARATNADDYTLDIDSARWTATDDSTGAEWSTTGNPVAVSDLPAGVLDLSVEVEAGGMTLTDSIEVSVYAN